MTAEEFKQRRERLGLTQPEIAEKLGIAQSTVARWESGATEIPPYRARLLEIDLRGVRPKKRIERRGRPRKPTPTAE